MFTMDIYNVDTSTQCHQHPAGLSVTSPSCLMQGSDSCNIYVSILRLKNNKMQLFTDIKIIL